jgi:hypothetical protein
MTASLYPKPMTLEHLRAQQAELVAIEVAAGEPLFLRLPDRWYERFPVRCVNGHVSRHVIKSEVKGDMCPACLGPCLMTFPGDTDDPGSEAAPT